MTSPTGSLPAVPKVPAARPVVKARMPKRANSSTASATGSSGPAGTGALLPGVSGSPAGPPPA
ncbi:MAG TPA: hypothetical protein VGD77_13785 [Gemmatimonadaceae bacterium]